MGTRWTALLLAAACGALGCGAGCGAASTSTSTTNATPEDSSAAGLLARSARLAREVAATCDDGFEVTSDGTRVEPARECPDNSAAIAAADELLRRYPDSPEAVAVLAPLVDLLRHDKGWLFREQANPTPAQDDGDGMPGDPFAVTPPQFLRAEVVALALVCPERSPDPLAPSLGWGCFGHCAEELSHCNSRPVSTDQQFEMWSFLGGYWYEGPREDGRLERSVFAREQALRAAPEHPSVLQMRFEHAQSLDRLGQVHGAMQALAALASETDPQSELGRSILSFMSLLAVAPDWDRDDNPDAFVDLDRPEVLAIVEGPLGPRLVLDMARRLGRYRVGSTAARAVTFYEFFLERWPTDTEAGEAAAELESLHGTADQP